MNIVVAFYGFYIFNPLLLVQETSVHYKYYIFRSTVTFVLA